MGIDSVRIKEWKLKSRPDTHVSYAIEVSTKSSTWTVHHRFSDFVDLHAELSKKFTIKESLPPKKLFGANSPEVSDQRKIGLEVYLKSITFSENQRLAESAILYKFLEFEPSSQESSLYSFQGGSWLDQHKSLEALCSQISVHIANHERALSVGDGNADELLEAKKKIVQLTAKLSELGENLNAEKGLAEGEVLRRKDMIAKLRIEKETLDKRIRHPKVNNENRSELMAKSGDAKGPRVFGNLETEQTRGLDDHGLIRLQQETMAVQDKDLDALMATLSRQKQLGMAIGDELDSQNKLLDELDADVDHTRAKLKKNGKNLTKLSANA